MEASGRRAVPARGRRERLLGALPCRQLGAQRRLQYHAGRAHGARSGREGTRGNLTHSSPGIPSSRGVGGLARVGRGGVIDSAISGRIGLCGHVSAAGGDGRGRGDCGALRRLVCLLSRAPPGTCGHITRRGYTCIGRMAARDCASAARGAGPPAGEACGGTQLHGCISELYIHSLSMRDRAGCVGRGRNGRFRGTDDCRLTEIGASIRDLSR